MLKCSRDDSLLVLVLFEAFHGVRFSSPCLSVGEDSTVIPLKNAFNDGESGLLKDSLLLAARLKGQVEAEDPLFFSSILGVMDNNFTSIWKNTNY
jgi:hypothetical protein